jgi:hypothetical protein
MTSPQWQLYSDLCSLATANCDGWKVESALPGGCFRGISLSPPSCFNPSLIRSLPYFMVYFKSTYFPLEERYRRMTVVPTNSFRFSCLHIRVGQRSHEYHGRKFQPRCRPPIRRLLLPDVWLWSQKPCTTGSRSRSSLSRSSSGFNVL